METSIEDLSKSRWTLIGICSYFGCPSVSLRLHEWRKVLALAPLFLLALGSGVAGGVTIVILSEAITLNTVILGFATFLFGFNGLSQMMLMSLASLGVHGVDDTLILLVFLSFVFFLCVLFVIQRTLRNPAFVNGDLVLTATLEYLLFIWGLKADDYRVRFYALMVLAGLVFFLMAFFFLPEFIVPLKGLLRLARFDRLGANFIKLPFVKPLVDFVVKYRLVDQVVKFIFFHLPIFVFTLFLHEKPQPIFLALAVIVLSEFIVKEQEGKKD